MLYFKHLPAINSSYENIYPPLAQSDQLQKNTKNIRFTVALGHERSQGSARQSYAQASGNIHPDSNQVLERLKELHHTMLIIDQKLSGNLTMPEFNSVNHNFFCALDPYTTSNSGFSANNARDISCLPSM